ncbi:MAG: UDP-galactopyranose mutase [Lachnospiraceae bacterium]|nr:UDP-galactopyranose mutase [Lachnospiraceae bacterium]
MLNKKYYVVGSGIVGCVIAHELAAHGAKVHIFEKRSHTGGNLFDFTDEHGIHVHLYGPHIFHTQKERVWEYVSRYCNWEDYNLVCGSVMDGICVPTSFDFESIDRFFPEEAEVIKEHIKLVFGEQKSATVLEMLECEDGYVRKFAQYLYDKDYAPYTAKQWGISPEKVDRQIFKRVPILFSYGSKYFDDTYQAMPRSGYMELIENLLNHENITVQVNMDALDIISIKENIIYINGEPADGTVVYTGPIDELFQCQYGKLPYRSLRFEWKYEDKESFQDMPVVAYPQAEGYTRITEYKKLPYQKVRGTTYAIEYPIPYQKGADIEPYYPVLTEESAELSHKYFGLAGQIKNLRCCGRLADFKYYNIDQAIDRALDVAEELRMGD